MKELASFINHLCEISQTNILSYYKETINIQIKSDQSPVTIADQSTEEIMRKAIEKEFPDHAILGEEFGESGKPNATYKWILDPIDGTKSFIHKIPLFGTLIALLKNGQPYIGCINIPCTNERVLGITGQKTTLNGKEVSVKTNISLEQSLLLTSCIKDCQQVFGNNFTTLVEKTKYTRTWGDCYGHLMVATGRAEIMADPIMNLWDIAALKPCIEGAGGVLFDLTGRTDGLGNQAISCAPELKEPILKILTKNV